MRKLLVLAALGGAMALGACASGGGYYGAGYGYNYAPVDVWYDGYYGPYADGYWGDGGVFFYRGTDGNYYRDQDNHFQTHQFDGSQHFHAGHPRH